jgi:hypothetical protein
MVDVLGAALRAGGHALGAVPELLKQVLQQESWRDFETKLGAVVHYERFAEFVVAPPLRGIGASLDLIERLIRDDPVTWDLYDRAVQNRQGRPSENRNNVTVFDPNPRGNSAEGALRRLRQDAPEVHARVVAGEISPNRGMVEAGLRPHTFTLRADSVESMVATLRRQLSVQTLRELREALFALDGDVPGCPPSGDAA